MPEIDVDKQPNDTLCPFRRKRLAVGEVEDMNIPSGDLNCVAFVLTERLVEGSLKKIPGATAFFVHVPSRPQSNVSWVYLVTARHVIEDADSDVIHIRVNKTKEGFHEFPTTRDQWLTHDTADVAAILFQPAQDEARDLGHRTIPLDIFVSGGPDYKYEGSPFGQAGGLPVSIGHEVFFLGLFVQHYGQERNLPVARFGRISRMPGLIRLPRSRGTSSFETVAYLAECHSWGGHSGSPTFWLHPMVRERRQTIEIGNFQAFLGLVSAHYEIPREAKVVGDVVGKIETDINAGIAVITPAEAIRQLLMRDDFVAKREKVKPLPEKKRRGKRRKEDKK